MDKENYETYEFLPASGSSTEAEPYQFFVVQDDGTFLINRQVQYVTQVQDTQEVLEGEQACTMLDVAPQQFYVDIDTTTEMISVPDQFSIPEGTNNLYANSYLLQPEAEAPVDQVRTKVELKPILQADNSVSETNKQDGMSGNNLTEITLTDEQYHILEQKGWILLETNEKVYVLDTLGLHDITNNGKLIQKLKTEDTAPSGTEARVTETEPGLLKIEYPPLNEMDMEKLDCAQNENKVEESELSLMVDDNIDSKDLKHEKSQWDEKPIAEKTDPRNKALVENLYSGVCDNWKDENVLRIRTDFCLKDIPDKIVLGKTKNGKRLVCRVIKPDEHVADETQHSDADMDSISDSIGSSDLGDDKLDSIFRMCFMESAVKYSSEDVAFAGKVIRNLVRLPAVKPAVANRNVLVTKSTVKYSTENVAFAGKVIRNLVRLPAVKPAVANRNVLVTKSTVKYSTENVAFAGKVIRNLVRLPAVKPAVASRNVLVTKSTVKYSTEDVAFAGKVIRNLVRLPAVKPAVANRNVLVTKSTVKYITENVAFAGKVIRNLVRLPAVKPAVASRNVLVTKSTVKYSTENVAFAGKVIRNLVRLPAVKPAVANRNVLVTKSTVKYRTENVAFAGKVIRNLVRLRAVKPAVASRNVLVTKSTVKYSTENVAFAEKVIRNLVRLPAVKPAVANRNVLVTKSTVKYSTEDVAFAEKVIRNLVRLPAVKPAVASRNVLVTKSTVKYSTENVAFAGKVIRNLVRLPAVKPAVANRNVLVTKSTVKYSTENVAFAEKVIRNLVRLPAVKPAVASRNVLVTKSTVKYSTEDVAFAGKVIRNLVRLPAVKPAVASRNVLVTKSTVKYSTENVAFAGKVIRNLVRLPAVKPAVANRNVLVTKVVVTHEDANLIESLPTLVTGEVVAMENTWRFVHRPELYATAKDELSQSLDNYSGVDHNFLHIHIHEIRLQDIVRTSVTLNKRRLELSSTQHSERIFIPALPLNASANVEPENTMFGYACGTCAAIFRSEKDLNTHREVISHINTVQLCR
ncbi:uncharacterized protein LOC134654340 [Cydia amplana]|uniref:uncharacterized protein LOC134654340 n=1 Tax=Cydia amplana TaxID=1869771 RepID=UPI002FE50CC4